MNGKWTGNSIVDGPPHPRPEDLDDENELVDRLEAGGPRAPFNFFRATGWMPSLGLEPSNKKKMGHTKTMYRRPCQLLALP